MVVGIEVREGEKLLHLEFADIFILKLRFNEDGRIKKKFSYLHE